MFKKLLNWYRVHRPQVLTQKKLDVLMHEIFEDARNRFAPQQEGMITDSRPVDPGYLSFDDARRQYESFLSSCSTGNTKHFFASSVVARAAVLGYLDPVGFHYRQQTFIDLQYIQDLVYSRIFTDPYAKAIVDRFVTYVIGAGYNFQVPDEKVQAFLEKFDSKFRYTEFHGITGRRLASLISLGQFYLKVWVDPGSGDSFLDVIQTYEVEELFIHPVRRSEILAYKIRARDGNTRWVKDIRADEYVKDPDLSRSLDKLPKDVRKVLVDRKNTEYIQHTKLLLTEEPWGRSPFESILKDLKYRIDFKDARVILNRERSRVIWKKIYKGAGMGRQSTETYTTPPARGIMLIANDNVDYQVISADIRADDVKEDYKTILRGISAALQIPLEILDIRGDESVYASIKRNANPFYQMIMVLRSFITAVDTELFRFILQKKKEFGASSELPKTVPHRIRNPRISSKGKKVQELFIDKKVPVSECPISIIWANNFSEDWSSMAGRVKTLTEPNKDGQRILSIQTARTLLNLDSPTEDMYIELEREMGVDPNDGEKPKKDDADLKRADDREGVRDIPNDGGQNE